MRTLVIDTATEACSVALFTGSNLIAGECRHLNRGHAEALVPMIAALPERGKATRIAVAVGPGSFTGLRVGIAAARALALVWHAELVGYPSLTLVAAMAQNERPGEVGVAMTGGHGQWFVQQFTEAGSPANTLATLLPELAVAALKCDRVAGSQATALVEQRGFGTALEIWPDARYFPLLAPSALTRNITPIYGRAPDARLPDAAA